MAFHRRVAMEIIVVAAVLTLSGAVPLFAQLEIVGYYWLAQPDGTGSVGIDGLGGTTFDFQDDLGYDDPESVFGATIVGGDRHQLGASFFGFEFSESNEIQADIRFSDLTYRVDTRLQSSIEATVARGFYRYRLGSESAHAGVILGGQYTDFAVRASAEGIGHASATLTALFPVIGAFADLAPVPWLGFRGSILGTTWEFEDTDITFIDAEALVRLVSASGLYAALGYRQLDIDGEDIGEAIAADVTFSGPVLLVGFEW